MDKIHVAARAGAPQAGLTLVEVMITLVVISAGLLGTLKGLYQSLADLNASYQRTAAVQKAAEMVERLRANRQGALAVGAQALHHLGGLLHGRRALVGGIEVGEALVQPLERAQQSGGDDHQGDHDLHQRQARLRRPGSGRDVDLVHAKSSLSFREWAVRWRSPPTAACGGPRRGAAGRVATGPAGRPRTWRCGGRPAAGRGSGMP